MGRSMNKFWLQLMVCVMAAAVLLLLPVPAREIHALADVRTEPSAASLKAGSRVLGTAALADHRYIEVQQQVDALCRDTAALLSDQARDDMDEGLYEEAAACSGESLALWMDIDTAALWREALCRAVLADPPPVENLFQFTTPRIPSAQQVKVELLLPGEYQDALALVTGYGRACPAEGMMSDYCREVYLIKRGWIDDVEIEGMTVAGQVLVAADPGEADHTIALSTLIHELFHRRAHVQSSVSERSEYYRELWEVLAYIGAPYREEMDISLSDFTREMSTLDNGEMQRLYGIPRAYGLWNAEEHAAVLAEAVEGGLYPDLADTPAMARTMNAYIAGQLRFLRNRYGLWLPFEYYTVYLPQVLDEDDPAWRKLAAAAFR